MRDFKIHVYTTFECVLNKTMLEEGINRDLTLMLSPLNDKQLI